MTKTTRTATATKRQEEQEKPQQLKHYQIAANTSTNNTQSITIKWWLIIPSSRTLAFFSFPFSAIHHVPKPSEPLFHTKKTPSCWNHRPTDTYRHLPLRSKRPKNWLMGAMEAKKRKSTFGGSTKKDEKQPQKILKILFFLGGVRNLIRCGVFLVGWRMLSRVSCYLVFFPNVVLRFLFMFVYANLLQN